MHKIWIIVKSEFWRRVRSKWFILITLLAPVFLIGIIALPVVFATIGAQGGPTRVAVVDETDALLLRLQREADDSFAFVAVDAPVDSVRAAVQAGRYDGYLVLPASLLQGEGAATFYSVEGGGLSLPPRLQSAVRQAVEQQRLAAQEVPQEVLDIMETRTPLRMVKLTDEGEETDGTVASSIIGYIMGFFIYVTVLIYGALVMQGVIEEKNSRVVEVMVSSVRPFQLLMGKVLGIGAMGLVQMAAWGALLMAISLVAGTALSLFIDPSQFNLPDNASQEALLAAADIAVPDLPLSLFVWFVLFFLGGYLLFASLYAAIGSAVENPQDAQALSLPLTLVVIIPILFITFVIESPNAPLSVILSMIPFCSPILMIVRLAVTQVPLWQAALSYLLLVGGFIGSIWLSGRIYRVGILMYGKKPNLKDIARWIRFA